MTGDETLDWDRVEAYAAAGRELVRRAAVEMGLVPVHEMTEAEVLDHLTAAIEPTLPTAGR